ncbi:MAG: hypothetical protein ACRD5Z_11670 [Bryobacteraceae bacterium]
MKQPRLSGDPFNVREPSNAVLAATMFAASVGMIWDLATGHVSAFDRMLSDFSDDRPTDTPRHRGADDLRAGF